jgi:hypothetical protein
LPGTFYQASFRSEASVVQLKDSWADGSRNLMSWGTEEDGLPAAFFKLQQSSTLQAD